MEDNTIKLDLSQFGKQEESPAPTVGETSPEPVSGDTQAELPGNQAEPTAPATPKNEAGDYVINLNPTEDAVQVSETEEVPVQPEAGSSEEVRTGLQEEEPAPLELVQEETTPEVTEPVAEESAIQKVEAEDEVQTVVNNMPEGIDKFVEFMQDTGLEGMEAMQQYLSLNQDVENMDQVTLLTEFYKAEKPFLTEEQIRTQLNRKYSYDPNSATEQEIEDKNIALQEELYKAKQFMGDRKEKYYSDLKLRQQRSLPPEAAEAVEFYSNYNKQQEETAKTYSTIKNQIDQVFHDEFKGFDFKVGESKYRFKVNDLDKQKENHKDFSKVFGGFLNEDGTLKDAIGYNKALFAAQNADKLAQHFYEQGRADAVKDAAKKSKNIDMDVRQDNSAVVTPSGTKVRVISGENKANFKPKMTIKGWNS